MNKNLAIANRSRVSCAHDTLDGHVYRPKYYTVTLKFRLRVTQGHWKRNHCIDHTRLDVEYYPDLEMRVRGHSRSLKMVLFESLGAVSYSPSIVTMAVSLAILEIFCVKEWLDLKIWVCGCSKSLNMSRFDRPYDLKWFNNTVTFKSGLEATQGYYTTLFTITW